MPGSLSENFSDLTNVDTATEAEEVTVHGHTVVRGVASLFVREGLLKIVVLAANVVLARVLAPSDFGIFVILGFFNTFLATFGSFGLAPAIVQRQQEPTRQELAALFSFQVSVAAALVLVAEVVAPILAKTYQFPPEDVWLIRAMAFGFLLTSAAATPMALLDRKLAFGRVAMVDVSTGIIYQACAVGLAVAGKGVWSLVAATLLSNAAGALITYVAAGWWPSFSLRWQPIFPMVRYGLKFQANNFIALLKDNITPTFVAAVAGAAAVGYINFAATLAYYPMIVVALISRVTFPAFSRVIHNQQRLQQLIEGTIRIQAYIILPAVAALAVFAPYLTHVIFTDKWQPAVPVLYFMLVSTMLSGLTSPLIAGLNSLGRPGVVSGLMLMWLVLDWGFIVPLVLQFGFVGYGMANAIVALSAVMTVAIFKRHQPVRFVRTFALPLGVAATTSVVFFAVSRLIEPVTLPLIVVEGLGLCITFAAIELAVDRHFLADVRTVLPSRFR